MMMGKIRFSVNFRLNLRLNFYLKKFHLGNVVALGVVKSLDDDTKWGTIINIKSACMTSPTAEPEIKIYGNANEEVKQSVVKMFSLLKRTICRCYWNFKQF